MSKVSLCQTLYCSIFNGLEAKVWVGCSQNLQDFIGVSSQTFLSLCKLINLMCKQLIIIFTWPMKCDLQSHKVSIIEYLPHPICSGYDYIAWDVLWNWGHKIDGLVHILEIVQWQCNLSEACQNNWLPRTKSFQISPSQITLVRNTSIQNFQKLSSHRGNWDPTTTTWVPSKYDSWIKFSTYSISFKW